MIILRHTQADGGWPAALLGRIVFRQAPVQERELTDPSDRSDTRSALPVLRDQSEIGRGEAGAKGEKGEIGERVERGETGSPGLAGPPGPSSPTATPEIPAPTNPGAGLAPEALV